jgi:hypothetical protein
MELSSETVRSTNDEIGKLSSETNRPTRLDWSLKTLVGPYEKAGHTNPKWDEPAKRALTELARVTSQTTGSNEAWGLIISNNCAAAVDAGCDDPMIHYMYIRYCMYQHGTKQAMTDALCKAAENMEKSSYPDIRKFYACDRADEQMHYTYGYGTNVPPQYARMAIWGNAVTNLLNALSDRTIPPEEFYEASHAYLEKYKGSSNQYSELSHYIEDRFPGNWKNVSIFLLLKGEADIEMAWHARGKGYVNTVTSNGWKLFAERLVVAENDLTHAWQLNTNDPRIAVKMMWVELGKGQGRDRMELWFRRTMELDPKNYDGCWAKLLYLEPKWYGTVPDMLTFGRECIQNKLWGGRVPLIIVDAHSDIRNQFVDASEKTNYWKRPEVWLDLKDAYDRFLEVNPEAIGWYHNYAWYAYKAEDWATLNAIIPKLGPVNYDYFGGKNEFDKMVALAKEHAGKIKSKD